MSITRDESGSVLRVRGTLDIAVAEELHRALHDFLEEAPDPVVDLSGMESCDISTLQLLWAARRWAERTGKSVRFAGLSGAAAGAAAGLGLSIEELESEGQAGAA